MSASQQRRSLFRAALAERRTPALGTWVKLPATEVVEILAHAGFDFVVIDLEHSPLDLESVFRLIGTGLHTGVSPIVRVPGLDPGLIARVLDAGAEGVMVPHVDTVAEARAAVAAARFSPLGSRGVGATSRAGLWGALPREEYLRFGRDEVVVIAQIESAAGVANSGAVAAVEGVDALLVGTADLSVGEQLAEDDPALAELVGRVVREAKAAGRPVGNAGGASAEAVRSAVAAGFDFTLMSNDAGLLSGAARSAVAAAAGGPAAAASGAGGAEGGRVHA
ncbi:MULTISPECIES: HpcH/HpaI aldolase family protein [unclassified Streptomyces]|uniref:HpcH/HpaI aldolase family protein n=1 Tax=unclassified Streptomyces TaxID=2593676 RepID=UPI000F71FFDA|nr:MULTISPECIES: aldolase/citrate lyase family protein [unclassified Streptomyces]AZM58232.1 2,4-dihydroxyhept-2-ene-1,7-dioic acid aldolase [Streptomyces sp. WAC 01438]RSM98967.1 2,4-dihydroxyhept-2-ene-1,7-dioic acid aldolase [Streptomyces sp. WAC 01420]